MTRTIQLHLTENKEVFAHLNSDPFICSGLGLISSVSGVYCIIGLLSQSHVIHLLILITRKLILSHFSVIYCSNLFITYVSPTTHTFAYAFKNFLSINCFIYPILYSWYVVQISRNSSSA